jgi:hypothetical protein
MTDLYHFDENDRMELIKDWIAWTVEEQYGGEQ